MPYWSAFTPYGQVAYSSRPSMTRQLFDALAKAYGRQYSLKLGTHLGAKVYATARTLAAAALTVERGAHQREPLQAREMLPALERQYRISPSPTDSVDARRRFLAAKYMASRGATPSNVLLAMTLLLGTDLVAVVYPTVTPQVNGPPDPSAAGTFGNFTDSNVPMERYAFVDYVCTLGSAVEFRYAPDRTDTRLKVGDVVVAQYENWALAEKVTITAAREATTTEALTDASPRATATFTKVKEVGASLWTGPRPFWNGTGRYALVVGTAAAAHDPETRRKVDEVLEILFTGVSTWAFVEQTGTSPRSTGPFLLGSSFLGSNTLDTVEF